MTNTHVILIEFHNPGFPVIVKNKYCLDHDACIQQNNTLAEIQSLPHSKTKSQVRRLSWMLLPVYCKGGNWK